MPPTADQIEPRLRPAPARRFWITAGILVTAVILGCAIYANLAYAVTDRQKYVYFPPFKKNVNANHNDHLGAEYFNIAQALATGEGFSSPWDGEKTGPTAWMPPVLPFILALFLWLCDGNKDAVMAIVIALQVYALVGAGIFVHVLARQTTTRLWALAVAGVFIAGVLCDFHRWFQDTHDSWLILITLNLVIAGVCWCAPMHTWKHAVGWGLFGGLCAMINPIIVLPFSACTLGITIRERAWYRFGIVAMVAALAMAPWTVRNYLVFGTLIPVKSNAAYELYQSQCLQKDGLLQNANTHPCRSAGPERQDYKALGEIEFVAKRNALFWLAVREDPLDFADRVASRFLGATLWYLPLNRNDVAARPWVTWTSRVTFPLPFLSLLFLASTMFWRPLHGAQWCVMGVYVLYLLPYIVMSYYDRYAIPLLAVKILLALWSADRLLVMLFGAPRPDAELVASPRPEKGSAVDNTN